MAEPPEPLHLDELVLRLVRAVRRPEYRSRLLKGVEAVPGINALRVLRSVERRLASHGSVSIRDVASDLEIEQSTASRSVNITIKDGLLSRKDCTEDLRRVELELTAAGQVALARATANRMGVLAEVTADWSPADLSTLVGLLERLVTGYDDLEAHGGG